MKKLHSTTIHVPYNSPLHWPFLLTFFSFHQISGIETVSQNAYERVFVIDGYIGFIQVTCDVPKSILIVKIISNNMQLVPIIVQKIRQVFDLDFNLNQLKKFIIQHSMLKNLWLRDPGLRIARGWNEFEVVINTILGQLISTQQAQKLMAQIAQHCGKLIVHPLHRINVSLFPEPAVLAHADLNFLKITQMKKRAISDISQRIAHHQIDLLTQDSNILRIELLKVPGIGHWSAEYILLRLGHKDAFPKGDLVLKRAVKFFPGLAVDNFKPWRSYLALYLWKYYIDHRHIT